MQADKTPQFREFQKFCNSWWQCAQWRSWVNAACLYTIWQLLRDRAANNYIELYHSILVWCSWFLKGAFPLLPASFSLVSTLRREGSLDRRVCCCQDPEGKQM